MTEILLLLGGALLGALAVYFILAPKVKATIALNTDIQQQNKELETSNIQLHRDYEVLLSKREELQNSISSLEAQAKDAADVFYKNAYQIAQTSFDSEIDKISADLDQHRTDANNAYLAYLKECVDNFQQEIADKYAELAVLDTKLAQMRIDVATAVEARKREKEQAEQINFYRLVLSEEDIKEIIKLREVIPFLRDSEPLNKVIYKVYYEKPYTDLIGRVVGTGIHTGIYKITNMNNGMCYVGQAANIAERWRQHIKRGVGAEVPTRNKLYPAMLEDGVENFTFEIVEECDRSQLDAREDYWQDYFHAKDFGYSIK